MVVKAVDNNVPSTVPRNIDPPANRRVVSEPDPGFAKSLIVTHTYEIKGARVIIIFNGERRW